MPLRRTGRWFVFFSLLHVAVMSENVSAAWSVWAEPLLADKIRPDHDPADKPAAIQLRGARGEWLAFHVIARPTGESVSSWVPSVQSSLRRGTHAIPDKQWTFSMVQMVSTRAATYKGQPPGSWPDPCVPYKDRFYGETRNASEQGWGKTIPAGKAQPFLYEIYIPADAAAGAYSGTIRLAGTGSSSGPLSRDITVNLQVWDFVLPVTWSYGSLFAIDQYQEGDGIAATFGSGNWGVALDMMTKAAVDHGMWPYGASSYMVPGVNPETGAAIFEDGNFNHKTYGYANWLDGTVANSANSPRPYRGFKPKAFEIRTNQGGPPAVLKRDAAKLAKYYDDWDAFIAANGYGADTKFMIKIHDEASFPDCCTGYARSDLEKTMEGGTTNRPHIWPWSTLMHAGCGPNDCAALGNKNYHLGWCPLDMYGFFRPDPKSSGHYRRSVFDARIAAKGDIVWVYGSESANDEYNAYAQDAAHLLPSWAIDSIKGARENAANALEMWIFDTTGYHYYAMLAGFGAAAWDNPDAGGFGLNGDGILLYFGAASSAGAHDVGGTRDIPIESVRMKYWRWGMQVLEYAKLLEARGRKTFATARIAAMVTLTEQGNSWGTVAAWEAARDAMGTEIERLEKSGGKSAR